ncbi:MAG: 3-deoxy-D-manno-octulosonic acid transferase [Flavipsychrobacter sp.]|jgi:3-deoxy-D-manno-octulosonic-acid transferase|nr:3-deoxy-D-manno-octulosonic acid transferase [Flavipsychrobacter sp.]
MLFLYNFFLFLYQLAIKAYSVFNAKAQKWVDGRKGWEQHIAATLKQGEKRIWFHCSSVGEYEQAKPLIEVMKAEFPAYKIIVTFFSPSGYEACKDSKLLDYVFYLPHDNNNNAERFVSLVAPSMALFVKYEFWYHYLQALKTRQVPTMLVSGAFRSEQPFFKWYGSLFRKMLQNFTWFFVQDDESKKMLNKIGIESNVIISGDTRYDRVATIANNLSPIPAIEEFQGNHKILIAGSTWPGDEEVLKECLELLPDDWKLVLVPHEIDDAHIKKIQQLFDNKPILFTDLKDGNTGYDKKVLIVNTMGMLSRMYSYGEIAFIGGGFQKGGIHNILEPAVFGLPVLFGPIYEKFVEAKELVAHQYVFPVNDAAEAKEKLKKLIEDVDYRQSLHNSLKKFMQEHIGASGKVVDIIQKKKWLI